MAVFLFRDWKQDLESMRPTQLFDQDFGLGMSAEDLLAPLTIPRRLLYGHSYYRPWKLQRQDSGSVVKSDQEKFQVNLDVQQFSPDEIQVKIVNNCIVVEGKHEEKEDEHGLISRHFVRRYMLPEGIESDKVTSFLSTDGILTVTAVKNPALESKEKEKIIPITHTGPHKNMKEAIEEGKNEEQ